MRAVAPPLRPRAPFRRRTRLIAWAKVLLPLAALALMSTLFLMARGPGAPAALPFARLSEIAAQPRLDAPRLAGVTADGTRVVLSADRLSPVAGRPDALVAERPRLEADAPDGRRATLAAPRGEVDGRARTLRLTGGVDLRASGGIEARAATALADLDTGLLTAAGGVEARAPFGSIASEGLTALAPAEGKTGGRVVFNGGVRLLYVPGAAPPPAMPPAIPGPP